MKCFTKARIRRFKKFNSKERILSDLKSYKYYIKIIKFIRQNYAEEESPSLVVAVVITGIILLYQYGYIFGTIAFIACCIAFLYYWVLWDRFTRYSSDIEKKRQRRKAWMQ